MSTTAACRSIRVWYADPEKRETVGLDFSNYNNCNDYSRTWHRYTRYMSWTICTVTRMSRGLRSEPRRFLMSFFWPRTLIKNEQC
jgi:hypothetical protein